MRIAYLESGWQVCMVVFAAGLITACTKDTTVNVDEQEDGGAIEGPQLPDCSDAGVAPGTNGPPMVRVARTDGTCFWMDSTEVTWAAYEDFLDADVALQGESPCEWNDSYEPSCAPLDEEEGADSGADCPRDPEGPVVCVDWCDAMAYCTWAGKTLCKGDYDSPTDSDTSSWYSVCSHGGANAYPYGKDYEPIDCYGIEFSSTPPQCPQVAGTLTTCSTEEGVLDLSGNVAEWVDACKNPGTDTGECRYRGGSFKSEGHQLACETASSELMKPQMKNGKLNGRRSYIGFRCCAYKL